MIQTSLKILEIGEFCLFKKGLPENTTLIWTGISKPGDEGMEYQTFGARRLRPLLEALSRNRFDLIVCHAAARKLWNPEATFLRTIFYAGRKLLREPRRFGIRSLMFPTRTPIVVLDLHDSSIISKANDFLLTRCQLYFKRELPLDFLEAFADRELNSRTRKLGLYRTAMTKLRPISLGLSNERLAQISDEPVEKTTDVFFAGHVQHSTLRQKGLAQLRALRDHNLIIDIADARLPPQDYFDRCRRSWLTWSPKGLGWECFRHYEAPLCGSVPVISRATIHRHAPFEDRVHCFYYDPEGDHLTGIIREALRDKERLRNMAEAARQHVLSFKINRALCEYVIHSLMQERHAAS